MATKLITVTGATGNQGAGVIETLLKVPNYRIRAITRRPDSDAAKAFQARGIEVVQADLNDVESLKAAFAGSHAIFAVTDFFEPFSKSGPDHAIEVETQQGINLATAAAGTPTLENYIWSTLPNSSALSGGKYLIPHFFAKNKIDAVIRANKDLLSKTTFLWVTWYASNYSFPMFTPSYVPSAGKFIQLATHAPNTKISTIGDVRANIGPFVEAILEHSEITRNGAIVKAAIQDTTADGLLQMWANAVGKKAVTVGVSIDSYNSMWPMWAEEMGVMMRFWSEFQEKSWTELGTTILTTEALGIDTGKFVGLDISLKSLVY